MKRTFRHARQEIEISLNETTNPYRHEWKIVNTRVGGYAPLEWLAEYIAIVAAEEIKATGPETIDPGRPVRVARYSHRRIKAMWIADGKRLIALEGRDIKLEHKDIVFEGKNIEVLRHKCPNAASAVFQTIVKRLTEKGQASNNGQHYDSPKDDPYSPDWEPPRRAQGPERYEFGDDPSPATSKQIVALQNIAKSSKTDPDLANEIKKKLNTPPDGGVRVTKKEASELISRAFDKD